MKAILARLAFYNLSALALTVPPPLPLTLSLALVAIHGIGLAVVAQLMRAPLWAIGMLMLGFAVAQLAPCAKQILSPALLAPFWFAYAIIALRFVWIRVVRGNVEGYFEYALPDPRVLLHFEFILGAALTYTALILVCKLCGSRQRGLVLAAVGASTLVSVWAIAEFFGHRTFGAAGSDPFAYVQMGVDLATRGTFAHRFDLFSAVAQTDLSWFPILHVGYRLPFTLDGDAITVWPPTGSVAYALSYRLGGEDALYLVNPFFSLLSAVSAGLLAWELTQRDSRTLRVVCASATFFLVATSNEVVNWAGVTMVDTQALVFSTLSTYSALRVYRTGKWQWALAAGITWGLAFLVRHTQLVLGLAFLPLILRGACTPRIHFRNLALLGFASLIVALPDLWYHQIHLGGWLNLESEELALYSLRAVPHTLAAIGERAFIGAEFGWLVLFIALGIVVYTRREKIPSSALLLWLGATLLIHLPYPALRWRDLLPQIPIIAFYAIYGAAGSIAALWQKQRGWAPLLGAVLLFAALELVLVRVGHTVPRAIQEAPPRFGAMTHAQRASFDALAEMTPPNALIGASLNSGAIELYAKRRAFRPADWSEGELREFLVGIQSEDFEFYFLEDSEALTRVLNDLRQIYRVEPVRTLDVPLFGDEPIENAGALWRIAR